MKLNFLKLSLAVLLLGAMSFAISNTSIKAENPTNAENAELNYQAEQLNNTAVQVYCGGWYKTGTGSECCGYHNGMCIATRYWDKETRHCYNVATNQAYNQHRNTNYRTAGSCN